VESGREEELGNEMTFAANYINAWRRVSADVDVTEIDQAVKVLAEARNRDATVWSVGNGGGSALASHLAIGLTLNTKRSGGKPFRANCLGADTSALSAATNDFGSENALRAIFECNARSGDVLCAFSVSGESINVNNTIAAAKQIGVPVIALVGNLESTTAGLADLIIPLGSVEPGIAEDIASAVMHAMYCTFMYANRESLPEEFGHAD
jgi:D-sedoheptulose 7-phosphate isomerase